MDKFLGFIGEQKENSQWSTQNDTETFHVNICVCVRSTLPAIFWNQISIAQKLRKESGMVDPSLHQSFCDKFIRTMPLKILTSKDKPAIFDWERVLDTYPYPPHDKAGVENYMPYLNENVQTEQVCCSWEFEHSSARNSFLIHVLIGAGIHLYPYI